MKKIVIILSSFLISSFIFSQEPTSEKEEEKDAEDVSRKISTYSPSFIRLKSTDSEIEKQDYELVKTMIADIENVYLKYLIDQMEVVKNKIDFKRKYQSSKYTFQSGVNYFDEVISRVRDYRHLYNGIDACKRSREKFLMIRDALEANNIPVKELDEIEFKLKNYNAIFHMFKGEISSTLIAIDDFDYIIDKLESGNALVEGDQYYIDIHTYLAGCHHRMYEKHAGDIVTARFHLQKELYHLWQLVDLKAKDNDKLKAYKYKNLVKTYYDIIDTKSAVYTRLYKPYMDEIGGMYQHIETQTQETSEGSEESEKSDTPN